MGGEEEMTGPTRELVGLGMHRWEVEPPLDEDDGLCEVHVELTWPEVGLDVVTMPEIDGVALDVLPWVWEVHEELVEATVGLVAVLKVVAGEDEVQGVLTAGPAVEVVTLALEVLDWE